MPYPDSAIDRALAEVTNAYVCDRISKKRLATARATMIRMRDEAGPRTGAEPTDDDLRFALNMRAKDVLGLSPVEGFYVPLAQTA